MGIIQKIQTRLNAAARGAANVNKGIVSGKFASTASSKISETATAVGNKITEVDLNAGISNAQKGLNQASNNMTNSGLVKNAQGGLNSAAKKTASWGKDITQSGTAKAAIASNETSVDYSKVDLSDVKNVHANKGRYGTNVPMDRLLLRSNPDDIILEYKDGTTKTLTQAAKNAANPTGYVPTSNLRDTTSTQVKANEPGMSQLREEGLKNLEKAKSQSGQSESTTVQMANSQITQGTNVDMSKYSAYRASTDKNSTSVSSKMASNLTYDKTVKLADGTEMMHFKSADGDGFAWYKAEDVKSALNQNNK